VASGKKGVRLEEIVSRLGGVLEGDGSVTVTQVATLASAGAGQIAFLANPKYRGQLRLCQASAVIVHPQFSAETALPRILHQNPYAYYARVTALLNPAEEANCGVSSSAVVKSKIPASARILENVVVGRGVSIGENVTLLPGCVIGDEAAIGDGSVLYPNVVIYPKCVIGKRAIIHAGAVIGSDGFGFAKDGEDWVKIPQIGRVVIGDDVEIGANTSIDRGALDDTVIGNGVIIDNQCQIAHNVVIGDNTAVAGGVIMAGSLKIGRYCMIGGASVINGHMEICDKVTVTGMGMVMRPITEPGVYSSGIPLQPNKVWRKTAALVMNIDDMSKRLKSLERKVNQQD